MKYIRTKNDIYDLEDLRLWNISFMIVDDFIDFNSAGRHKILKQADTIEELCDRFVMFQDQNNFVITSDLDIVQQHCFVNDKAKGYGAIWTDKGLIYVAKMNEKGDWELL